MPDLASRKAILDVHLRNRPLADILDLEELAASTDGFSGADIAAFCSMSARSSIRRAVHQLQNGKPMDEVRITAEDIAQSLQDQQRTVRAKGNE